MRITQEHVQSALGACNLPAHGLEPGQALPDNINGLTELLANFWLGHMKTIELPDDDPLADLLRPFATGGVEVAP